MPIPVCTALCATLHEKTYPITELAPTKSITLAGSATNPTILEWEWSVLPLDAKTKGGYPEGSVIATGTVGDFTDGKSSVQNPTVTLDKVGGYCFTLRARNADGWSLPTYPAGDGTSCQAIVYILNLAGAKLPPESMFRYSDALNQTLARLVPALPFFTRIPPLNFIAWTSGGTAYQTAMRFSCKVACTVTGLRFITVIAGARTIRARMWKYTSVSAGTELCFKDVAASATGLYTVVFDTPQTVSGTDVLDSLYLVSVKDPSGYTYLNAFFNQTYDFGHYIAWARPSNYVNATTIPTSIEAAQCYPIEPTITVP